jgi:hypothetical protein
MPAKRSRKILPLKPPIGAVDFAQRQARATQAANFDDHVYRVIEIVGTSDQSIEDAVTSAIGRASTTLRNLRWFEVVRTSGHIDNGMVRHYQVTLKVGFTMEEVA